jgi:beta-glucosidase
LALFGGSPIVLGEAADLVDAIVFAWYPGEEGGTAIADALFGDANPSGRLPVTFPQSTAQLPPFEDYSMKGRTYRYMTQTPQYPFGYGLSYTTFAYGEANVSKSKIKKNESVDVSVLVTNSGNKAGEEVVQLYVKAMQPSVDAPLSSLKDFKRVALQPGESAEVTFTVTPEMMQIVNNDGKEVLEKGAIKLFIGGVSPSSAVTALGIAAPVEAVFTVK